MDGILRLTGAVKHDAAIDEWFKVRRNERSKAAQEWFLRIRQCGPDVRELIHDGCPVGCVQDAPFAYVNVFSLHASVGFFQGHALADPAGLLEGSGKRMRHVKLRAGAMPDPLALQALVLAAYLDIKERLGLIPPGAIQYSV